jgi:2-aminoadipate transaminase
VIGVETDDDGLRIDALERTLATLEEEGDLERVKLIYTVSEHSNPTGVSLSAERRGPLVEAARKWSKKRRIHILEDSAYRGLTYDGPESPSVWSHDSDGDTVILARTFSKTFSPGLRTGYGVVPESLLEPILRLKGNHDFGSSNFNQVVLERAIASGDYERQVLSLIPVYRRKRDVMCAALEQHFGAVEGVRWSHPSGGLFVWLTLPEGLDTGRDGPLFSRCLREGVLYVPGRPAFADAPGPEPTNHVRLCFGFPAEREVAEGVRRLAAALAGCLEPAI